MRRSVVSAASALCGAVCCAGVHGVVPDLSPDRVESPLSVNLPRIGTLTPRTHPLPDDDRWSISSTCLDRDFADFDEYKELLPQLGIRDVRFQAGWAKSEKVQGRFDLSWLDDQVEFCRAHGLNPMLETSYGNPIYEGGGSADLVGGIPSGEIGLAAWDRWVDELSRHFAGRVDTWLMWNEPDGGGKNSVENVAEFNRRTARIIKRNIPEAKIAAFNFAGGDTNRFERCLQCLGEDVRLFNRFIYHGYRKNPDVAYGEFVGTIKDLVAKYAPHAVAWQGENGAPSEMSRKFALSNLVWSEYSQAKWNLRRMLGDIGRDVPSAVFTFCDFYHDAANTSARRVEMNRKGLVRANEAHEVVAIKRAFYAVQNCVSVFDPQTVRVTEPSFHSSDDTVARFEYVRCGGRLLVFWDASDRPGESFQTRPLTLYSSAAPFKDPVWVDLMTGRVHDFPAKKVVRHSLGTMYLDVPVYDSPCLLAERSALDFK